MCRRIPRLWEPFSDLNVFDRRSELPPRPPLLVGKPYTPATTVTHPAHFDFVPTATMPSSMATSVRSTAAAAPAAPKRKGIDDSLHAKRAKAGNDTANYLHTTDAMCCE